ncbi:hypothetical protein KOW79_014409 [Hemibagrus wyckioides]|uniref:Secreted protein n=1 Tax=Hemibagrus wyckioides TaxID=337641 RepID=A0A9D3NDT2_9TELE|nr:hypothetical protein KOW79_014409 [Hemibagrus wyckioides]
MAAEVYLLWLLPLLQSLAAFGAELSSEACRELGFSSSAARRRLSSSPGSSTPEPSSRSVDENWGGSLKSKLSSGATSQRCSRAFRLSTCEARILC